MPEVSQKVNGHDNMRRDSWFKMAANGTARTSKAAELRALNMTKGKAFLETRSKFFEVSVDDERGN
jgi:hypothetical protein